MNKAAVWVRLSFTFFSSSYSWIRFPGLPSAVKSRKVGRDSSEWMARKDEAAWSAESSPWAPMAAESAWPVGWRVLGLRPHPYLHHPSHAAGTRVGPTGRCLLPPLPGKPLIINYTSLDSQYVFIIPASRASSRVRLAGAGSHPRRKKAKEGGDGWTEPALPPTPAPPMPLGLGILR